MTPTLYKGVIVIARAGTNQKQGTAMLKHNDTQMLSVKELAWRLNRHPNYVYLMKKAGYTMPGYRSTLEAALKWLEDNPDWRKRLE